MINILITEFIDPEALKILSKDFNVIYKKKYLGEFWLFKKRN